jgi:hypothetical protein
MSDTQPSPAAMEAANKIITDIENAGRPIADRIARAIDAFKRDAVRAAVEKCCGVMCPDCLKGKAAIWHSQVLLHHDVIGSRECFASNIRLAFADVLEGRE